MAWPDGKEVVRACVPQVKTLGRGRSNTFLSRVLSTSPPSVAQSISHAAVPWRVSARKSAATVAIMPTTVPVPRKVISSIAAASHGMRCAPR
jgi:hypothetical protein